MHTFCRISLPHRPTNATYTKGSDSPHPRAQRRRRPPDAQCCAQCEAPSPVLIGQETERAKPCTVLDEIRTKHSVCGYAFSGRPERLGGRGATFHAARLTLHADEHAHVTRVHARRVGSVRGCFTLALCSAASARFSGLALRVASGASLHARVRQLAGLLAGRWIGCC